MITNSGKKIDGADSDGADLARLLTYARLKERAYQKDPSAALASELADDYKKLGMKRRYGKDPSAAAEAKDLFVLAYKYILLALGEDESWDIVYSAVLILDKLISCSGGCLSDEGKACFDSVTELLAPRVGKGNDEADRLYCLFLEDRSDALAATENRKDMAEAIRTDEQRVAVARKWYEASPEDHYRVYALASALSDLCRRHIDLDDHIDQSVFEIIEEACDLSGRLASVDETTDNLYLTGIAWERLYICLHINHQQYSARALDAVKRCLETNAAILRHRTDKLDYKNARLTIKRYVDNIFASATVEERLDEALTIGMSIATEYLDKYLCEDSAALYCYCARKLIVRTTKTAADDPIKYVRLLIDILKGSAQAREKLPDHKWDLTPDGFDSSTLINMADRLDTPEQVTEFLELIRELTDPRIQCDKITEAETDLVRYLYHVWGNRLPPKAFAPLKLMLYI